MSGTLGAQMDKAKQPKKRKAASDDKPAKKPATKKSQSTSTEPDKPNFQKLPHKDWSIVKVVWETPHAMSDEEIAELDEPRMKHFSKLLVKHKNSSTPCFELMFRGKEAGKYVVANKKKQLIALKNATFSDGTKLTQEIVLRLRNRYPRSSTAFYSENPICGIISDRWAETLAPFKNAGISNRDIRKKPLRFKDKLAQSMNLTAPPMPSECAGIAEEEEEEESVDEASEPSESDDIGESSDESSEKELVKAVYLDEMGAPEEKLRKLEQEVVKQKMPDSKDQTDYLKILEEAELSIFVESKKPLRSVPAPRDKSPTRPASEPKKKQAKKASPEPAKKEPAKKESVKKESVKKESVKKESVKKKPVKTEPVKSPKKPAKAKKPAAEPKSETKDDRSTELIFRINEESQHANGKFPVGTKEHVSAESLTNLYEKLKDSLDKHMDRALYEKLRDTEFTLDEFFHSPLLRRHTLPLFYSLDAFKESVELFHSDTVPIELDQIAALSLAEFPDLNVDTQDAWHTNFRKIFTSIYHTRDPKFLERGTFLQHWERVGQWALKKRLGADIAQMFYDPNAIVRCWAGFFSNEEIGNYKKELLKNKNELLAVVHLWNTREPAATVEEKEEEDDESMDDDLLACM